MAVFNTSAFVDSVQIVRPNLFEAYLIVPSKLKSAMNYGDPGVIGSLSNGFWSLGVQFSANTAGSFPFRCEATELPGRTVNGIDIDEFGPAFRKATDVVYNDINLSIIASKDMQERRIFEAWIEYMVGNTRSLGGVGGQGGLARYYNDYIGTLELYQIDEQGNRISGYKLHNTYPISLGSMNANWEERDTYQRFSVTMSYRYHTVYFPENLIQVEPV